MPVNAVIERLEAAQFLLAAATALPVRAYATVLHRAFPVEHDAPQAIADLAAQLDGGKQ